MIDGVQIKQLKVIPDERGFLMEVLRCDDTIFKKFGQAYITSAYPGVIKAWHFHKIQTDFFTCIKGMIKLVLYDGRKNSKTKGEINEFFIGEKNPQLITIPPSIFHGFKGIGTEAALVLNIPNEPYNYKTPDEYRLPHNTDEIPYGWELKHG